MAAKIFVIFALLKFFHIASSQNLYFTYQKPSDCISSPSSVYFDLMTLSCQPCSDQTVQKTSADGLNCECQPGYKYTQNFGGAEVTCQSCGPNEAVSDDGWECIKCNTSFISETKTCQGCQPEPVEVSVERAIDGNWIKENTTVCQTCAPYTSLNGQGDRCIRCNNILAIRPELSNCKCAEDEAAGGLCFKPDDDLVAENNQLYTIPLEESSVESYFFKQNIRSSEVLCKNYNNMTACQVLVNMCSLLLYDLGSSRTGSTQACTLLMNIPEINPFKKSVYLTDEDAEDLIYTNDIPTSFTFSPLMSLEFIAGQFSINGEFLGFKDVTGGLLQLCDHPENVLDAAYVFGTVYSKSCELKALKLWDKVKFPTLFYDLYIKYTENSADQLHTVPILILNYRDNRGNQVNRESMNNWRSVKRFFLVDNEAGITGQGQVATVVRYVKSIELTIELQSETKEGKIYVPYFTIEYGEVSRTDAEEGAKVAISFSVSYSMSQSDFYKDFQIATGVLCSLGFLYGVYRTWVWSRRAGRVNIDFATLMNFLFFLSGSLSNCFFAITFGVSFYWLVFFKGQDAAFLVHPSGKGLEEWTILFIVAFVMKLLNVIHIIVMQCLIDIFFIDWERPVARAINNQSQDKRSKLEMPVSIWRTYFVANEWNELQGVRKLNKLFQVFAVLFFLKVVGFENVTTMDPDGRVSKSDDDYKSEMSHVFRYAISSLIYILVAIVQYIFFTFIYERFVEDKVRQFVDLCSMSNISVFIMSSARFGYYIHGRSVHGKSDTNMREMYDMMKKEEEDMCGKRGLEPDSEEQTFQMSVPLKLRAKYDQIYLPIALERTSAAGRMEQGKGRAGSSLEKSIESYSVLNKFLGAFIDHSFKDLDYKIIKKSLIENILDTEIHETYDTGVLYNDNGHSFDQVLFYGHELTLILFDVLLFCIVDYVAQDFVLAGVLTYLVSELLTMARLIGGKKNLASKTLVDDRFLI